MTVQNHRIGEDSVVLSLSVGDCSDHRLREDSLVLSLSVFDSSESQDRRGLCGIVTLRR